MGWQSDDGAHEGWDAAEFAGNRFSVGPGGGGALVRHFAPGPLHGQHTGEPETVDGRTAIGWRAMCECGWRGPLWQRGTDPGQLYGGHTVYAPDPGPAADVPEAIEHKLYTEWAAHLTPPSLVAVADAATRADVAQKCLDDAVGRARADGRSWADIGAAVGITRQSAHERWAKLSSPARAYGREFGVAEHDIERAAV